MKEKISPAELGLVFSDLVLRISVSFLKTGERSDWISVWQTAWKASLPIPVFYGLENFQRTVGVFSVFLKLKIH